MCDYSSHNKIVAMDDNGKGQGDMKKYGRERSGHKGMMLELKLCVGYGGSWLLKESSKQALPMGVEFKIPGYS